MNATEQRLFDVAVGEASGAESPPDVRARVLARVRDGDSTRRGGGSESGSPWLAVALVLLGIAVVIAVVVTSEDSPRPEPEEPNAIQDPLSAPELPPVIEVIAAPGAAVADPSLRNVLARSPTDRMTSFAFVQDLEHLERLEVGRMPPFNLLGAQGVHVRDDWFAPIAKCRKLRVLEIRNLGGFRSAHLRVLAGMPQLESITIDSVQWTLTPELIDELAAMPALRRLKLRNFTVTGEGFDELLRLDKLTSLDLELVQEVTEEQLAALATLENLEQLRLGSIGAHIQAMLTAAAGLPSALTPAVLARYDDMPKLESLEIDHVWLNHEHLQKLPTGLRRLNLRLWPQGEKSVAAALLALDRLEDLSLRFMAGPQGSWGSDALESLLSHRMFRRLDLEAPTEPAVVAALAEQMMLEEFRVTVPEGGNLDCVADLPSVRIVQVKPSSKFDTETEWDALCSPLRKLRRLEEVRIVGGPPFALSNLREMLRESVRVRRLEATSW